MAKTTTISLQLIKINGKIRRKINGKSKQTNKKTCLDIYKNCVESVDSLGKIDIISMSIPSIQNMVYLSIYLGH